MIAALIPSERALSAKKRLRSHGLRRRLAGEKSKTGVQPQKKQPLFERLLFLSRAESIPTMEGYGFVLVGNANRF